MYSDEEDLWDSSSSWLNPSLLMLSPTNSMISLLDQDEFNLKDLYRTRNVLSGQLFSQVLRKVWIETCKDILDKAFKKQVWEYYAKTVQKL